MVTRSIVSSFAALLSLLVAGEGFARTTYGMFDPAAPTITIEDIEEHQARRKHLLDKQASDSDRRRQESARRARQCYTVGDVTAVESGPKAAPPTNTPGASLDDLRKVPTNELIARIQRTQDPAVMAELQRRAQSGAAAPTTLSPPASNALEQLARVPGMDSRMADQLRLSARGSDPRVQACLEAAERIATVQSDEPVVDFVNLEPEETLPVRDGRTSSLIFDHVFLDDANVPMLQRFNVVMRSGPYGARAVPMRDAMARSSRKEGWTQPTQDDTARSLQILSKPSPLAQSRSKGSRASIGNAIDKLHEKLKAATSPPSPHPGPTSLPPEQPPPGPPAAQAEPPSAISSGAIGIDLESDERFKQSNPGAYDAYAAMSELIVVKQEAAYKKMPSQRELYEMSHTDREKLVSQRKREIADETKAREQALRDFSNIFFGTPVPPRLEEKKRIFEARIDAIDALDSAAQAEVLGRLVRDVKEINDNGSKPHALEIARGLFNIFPQAKTVSVKYRSRLTLGASHSQSNAFDYDVPVAKLKVKSGSVADYLSENSVMMTKLFRDEYATAHGMQRDQVENMLANNKNQRNGSRGK